MGNLDQLAKRLSTGLRRSNGAESYLPLFRQLLLLLVSGKPVSAEQIATTISRSSEIVTLLGKLPSVELDDEGSFYKDLLEAKLKFISTRPFWSD